MNNVTKRGDMDVTLDESTWGFGGYSGECGGRLINKPVARGMSLFVANCIIFVILLRLIIFEYIPNQVDRLQ
jgi:hypothetical protein